MTLNNPEIVLAVTAGSLVAYPFVMRGLAEAVQPKRLQLAQVGHELTHHPKVPDKTKQAVDELLDDAFDWKLMVIAAVVLPVTLVRTLVNRHSVNPLPTESNDAADKFGRFSALFTLSAAVANPLFSVVVALELILAGFVIAPLMGAKTMSDALFMAMQRGDHRLKHS